MGKFSKNYENERNATPYVIEWIQKTLNLPILMEVNDYAQKELDIDLYAPLEEGEFLTFENKIRFKEYNDVLIETVSNMNTLSEGWIYASKADYLVYVFYLNKIIKKGYIFNLPKLREWWEKTGRLTKYPIKYGKTSDLYKTQNVAVPERDIPLDCVIYHPNYGLLKSVDGGLDSSYFR